MKFTLVVLGFLALLINAEIQADVEDSRGTDVYIYVVVGFFVLLSCICYMCALMCFGVMSYITYRGVRLCKRFLAEKSAIIEDLNATGGTRREMLLTLRPGFEKKYSFMKPADFRLGKFYYTPEGKRIQLLDLEFKFRHRRVQFKGESERKFVDIFYNLRSGKYTAYSHCKYCFQEQRDFQKKYDSLCCCKCGLPVIRYIYFNREERFCVVCSLMNKYHPRPHIRCLLHPSGKGKKLGAMYVLYKEYFSISSASKPKKRTPKADKLEVMLKNEVWKLNSALRFEYLWTVRNLVRKNLTSRHSTSESFQMIRETRKEIIRRRSEIGPNMATNYQEHGLEINLRNNSFSTENKERFYRALRDNLTNVLQKIDDHIRFLEARERCYAAKPYTTPTVVNIGQKRKYETAMVEQQVDSTTDSPISNSSPQLPPPPHHNPNQTSMRRRRRMKAQNRNYEPRTKKLKVHNQPAVLKPIPALQPQQHQDGMITVPEYTTTNSPQQVPFHQHHQAQINNEQNEEKLDMAQIESHIDMTLRSPEFRTFTIPLDIPITNQHENSYLIPSGMRGGGPNFSSPVTWQKQGDLGGRTGTGRIRRRRKKKKSSSTTTVKEGENSRSTNSPSGPPPNFRLPPSIPLHIPTSTSYRNNSNNNHAASAQPPPPVFQRFSREGSSDTTTSEGSVNSTSSNGYNNHHHRFGLNNHVRPPPPIPNVVPSPNQETDNSVPTSPESGLVDNYPDGYNPHHHHPHHHEKTTDSGESSEEDVSISDQGMFHPKSLFLPNLHSVQPPPAFLTFSHGQRKARPPSLDRPSLTTREVVTDPAFLSYLPPMKEDDDRKSSFGSSKLSSGNISSLQSRRQTFSNNSSNFRSNPSSSSSAGRLISEEDSLRLSGANVGVSQSFDLRGSFQRDNMILEQDQFMSKGVVIKQQIPPIGRRRTNQQLLPPPANSRSVGEDEVIPKYDVDEYIASYTYNEDDLDKVIGDTIESPRNFDNNGLGGLPRNYVATSHY